MEAQWQEVGVAGFWSDGFVFVEGDQWSERDVLRNWPACKGFEVKSEEASLGWV